MLEPQLEGKAHGSGDPKSPTGAQGYPSTRPSPVKTETQDKRSSNQMKSLVLRRKKVLERWGRGAPAPGAGRAALTHRPRGGLGSAARAVWQALVPRAGRAAL